MIAWRPAAAAMDQERFEVRPLIVGHQSANQGCPPQRAALNQFAILASIGLSTRPSHQPTRNFRIAPKIATIRFKFKVHPGDPGVELAGRQNYIVTLIGTVKCSRC